VRGDEGGDSWSGMECLLEYDDGSADVYYFLLCCDGSRRKKNSSVVMHSRRKMSRQKRTRVNIGERLIID
jgi:hypothetical protein